jgi:hypothetical protein
MFSRYTLKESPMTEMIEMLRGYTVPSRELDVAICAAVMPRTGAYPYTSMFGSVRSIPIKWGITGNLIEGGEFYLEEAPRVTSSIDAAVKMCEKALPGWGWRVATCCVSDDAWVFPDFNNPEHGERLKREFSQDVDWADATDVDLRPSGRQAIALCLSVITALEMIKEFDRAHMEKAG